MPFEQTAIARRCILVKTARRRHVLMRAVSASQVEPAVPAPIILSYFLIHFY